MAKIVFYCRVEKGLFETVEFYRQDIDILKKIGHEVILCTRYREIPLNFDIIFIWWWTYAAWPILLSKLLGKPSIITGTFNFRFPENFNGTDYFHRPYYQRLLIKFAVKMASMNLFVNRLEQELCSSYFNIKNGRYCPHSLHNDYLQGPGSVREISILNISWSGKKNLIRKGIPELLKATKILKEEGINIKVYLAGHRGDGYEFLEKMILDLGLNSSVQLLGEVSKKEKINYLRMCEIYVQPSYYEGFGLAIAEAMGSGACLITCKVGAVEEVVGDAGIYVNPGSEKELAEAIKNVLQSENLRWDFQVRAHRRMKESFSDEKKTEIMGQLFQELNVR